MRRKAGVLRLFSGFASRPVARARRVSCRPMTHPPLPLKLLVVEDSLLDHELLVATLAMQGWPCVALRVESLQALDEALATGGWDLVISDHQLPGFTSADTWERVRAMPAPPPFIIVSGLLGEEAAVEAMQRGVDDYLVKGRLARLGTAVRNALAAGAARRAKEAAQARARRHEMELQALSAQLQNRVDAERTAIAREIHDEIGGNLTAVRFDLEAALRETPEGPALRLRRALEELSQVQQSAQRIMRDLRPPILDAGLPAALQWLAGQFAQRHGLAVRFEAGESTPELPPELAMTVYRACQEALTNVAKHAGASRVDIDLHMGREVLSLEIRDDGRGFDPAAPARPGHFGLQGLRERLRGVEGHLEVASGTQGTTLMMYMPRPDAVQASAAGADA